MTETDNGEVLLYLTAPDRGTALAIARALLEDRLIACANVIDGASSLYWWEGRIEEAAEALLIGKTTMTLMPSVTRRVKELHPYSCPCVAALPIVAGNPDFLGWIRAETGC
ncbi:divalent-cation tolerance protein CutA [Telmatospirillum siberiense]|uniref:Divalent-cation tolerance protein CutA n=1 Tax=Telmatospirillum siberiense TaxID=382514 RepID=A0A2N3PYS9_9PROT|nr:divalent-cation tolerance protein CutA [Telmatospirillum siberiense]PKU25584.1 divalent-cation tolerance protein CutA [Telmatospirillum siberiense]